MSEKSEGGAMGELDSSEEEGRFFLGGGSVLEGVNYEWAE